MYYANRQISNLNNAVRQHGIFRGVSLIHFGCAKFADTAASRVQSQELLQLIQKFTQLARPTVKTCIFLGVGPFPRPQDLDSRTTNLINMVTQRFTQTGWCICIDASALHCSREQVFVNCWWSSTYQYACERKRWKHNVSRTMDFLCIMIELALQASRDHVFAEAQRHLQESHRVPTLKTSDFGYRSTLNATQRTFSRQAPKWYGNITHLFESTLFKLLV